MNFGKRSDLKELAEHARQFADEMYPKVCALFADEELKPPTNFDIVFKPLKGERGGQTALKSRRIFINSEWLTSAPVFRVWVNEWVTNSVALREIFDKFLTHEMAHMALRHRYSCWSRPHFGWKEGMAHYAFYKLIGTNGLACPRCDEYFPHFSSGYMCSGAFLLYVEATCGSNVIRQLNRELRRNSYSDTFFAKTTGKSLDELWSGFQETSTFKPIAAEVYRLQQALGYKNGEPPKDIEARFKRFVHQHADAITKRCLEPDEANGTVLKNLQNRMTIFLYFTQPGGTPEQFLFALGKKVGLPGIAKGEKAWLSAFLKVEEMKSRTLPTSRTLVFGKDGDPSKYHYTVSRAAQESDWKLEKAWRSAPDGRVIEEYPVP